MAEAAQRRAVGAALAFGTAWLIAFWLETPGLNGPSYWKWPWRTLDPIEVAGLFAGPLLAYGVVVWAWSRTPQLTASEARPLVFGLAFCQLLLQWSSLRAEPGSWQWLDAVVRSPQITSYYTDAEKITDLASFLREYAWRKLEHHSSTHPPGPVLYYWAFIRVVGPEHAAAIGGACIGVLASFGVVLAHRFAALWTEDPSARIGVSCLYALMPALLMFLPSLDLLYPLFTMGSLVLWRRAFTVPLAAVWLGLTLFVATSMAYQCLALAAPLGLYALAVLRARAWDPALRRAIARAAVVAAGVWFGANLLIWLLTPFDPLDSFVAALMRQQKYAMLLGRPYWACLFFDLYDFLLGSGLLTLPLLGLYFARGANTAAERAITVAGLASILIVDASGLLRCEASRVWLFLQPLVLAPAGLQLARLAVPARGLVLGLLVLIVIGIKCKLILLHVP